jgi:Protein of unknown function (DUF3040)
MILSERERRVLAEIERQLTDTDPRFARAMGTPSGRTSTRMACAAVTVLACLSALLCAALSLIGPAIVAALLATATHYLHTRLSPRTGPAPDRSR